MLEENAVSLGDVGDLTIDDLHAMGINKYMHCKNMLKTFQAHADAEGGGAAAAPAPAAAPAEGDLQKFIVPGKAIVVGTLADATAGIGSLLGALVGAGIPEETAHAYQKDIEDGRVVMGVHPRDEDRDYVRQQYDTYGAENVYYNDPVTR